MNRNLNRCSICNKFKKWIELIYCEDIDYRGHESWHYECTLCIYDKEENVK